MGHSTGAKLGTRVAMLVSKSYVITHSKLAGAKHKLAMAIFHSISDVISNEVHDTIGDTLTKMHDALPEGSPAKPLLRFMSQDIGQLQAVIGMAAGSSGLFASIAQIMNNELAPIVFEAVGSNPHMIPDASTIAAMVARQQYDLNSGVVDIGKDGLSVGWAKMLIQLNTQYPGVADILELYRRNGITQDQALEWMMIQGIDPGAAGVWFTLASAELSPADAALAYLRGNMSEADAQRAAATYGYNSDQFNILVGNTGEPLGLGQLLEAYRRGFIDQATLEQGILESRIRNEWIPTALQLAYSPISVADAVNAVNQNQLDKATAETIAQQNGLEAGQLDILLDTAGEPLSRTEMEQLYNRGLVTEADVTQALAESRLKPKYTQLAFELHTRLLTPALLSDAVLYGAVDENVALGKVMELGYSQEDAELLVLSASNAKMFSYRGRVVEDISQLYEVNAIDETTAVSYITSMGWSTQEASVIIQASEFNRQKRVQSAAITSIRAKYVAHRILDTDVQTALQEIGVPAGEVSYLLNLWTIELDANIQYLTPVQVAKAVSAGLMDLPTGTAYLVARGYSASDATILAQVAG